VYTEIKHCRSCESEKLTIVLSLDDQVLTDVFPKSTKKITKGPLGLV
jgi:hypothetical protein